MLVLSRKVGTKIVVPQCDLVLQVLEVRGSSVKVGITAPDNVEVHRAEVWERLQQQGAADEVTVRE